MKKLLALLLSLAMVFALVACGNSGNNSGNSNNDSTNNSDDSSSAANPADAISDEMTSEDGKYEIAFVTDVGQLKDKSFNQGTYDGVKLYASAAGKSYKYYQPANGDQATDEDRYDAMKLAADNGAKVIVAAGFMQGNALAQAAAEFTDVKFVFIDGWPLTDAAGNVLTNVTGISFQEEQAGYLAGYAAVMEGYTKLGFSGGGGGSNAACDRFGYGFGQGSAAAAAAKGVQAEVNYSWLHGSSFQASPDLQTMISGWYQNGTEVVFACGGSMFQSVVAAADAEDGKVIGVDVDQSFESPTVITSAMKGIGEAAQQALKAAENDSDWAEWGGQAVVLGAAQDAVGLPTDTWSMENFSVEEYEQLFQDIVAGNVSISGDDVPEPDSTDNVTVNIVK